jgi:hypothetical protein
LLCSDLSVSQYKNYRRWQPGISSSRLIAHSSKREDHTRDLNELSLFYVLSVADQLSVAALPTEAYRCFLCFSAAIRYNAVKRSC